MGKIFSAMEKMLLVEIPLMYAPVYVLVNVKLAAELGFHSSSALADDAANVWPQIGSVSQPLPPQIC